MRSVSADDGRSAPDGARSRPLSVLRLALGARLRAAQRLSAWVDQFSTGAGPV